MAGRSRVRRRVARRSQATRVRRCACRSARAARTEAKGRMEDAGGLMIGGVRDPAEKAADRMAAQALSKGPVPAPAGGTGGVHRMCAECAAEEKAERSPAATPKVAPGAGGARASASASAAIRGLGAGRPLARTERAFFEPRFGRDFSGVRVHEDAAADRAARAIDARAFAWGTDIAFAKGERTAGGERLMAHELAHVAQEGGAARRAVHRSCHDGKCDKCAGGKKKLDLSFFFHSDVDKKSMGAVVKDFMKSQKVLDNCCLNLEGHFDLLQKTGEKVKTAPPARTTGPHAGSVDYDAKTDTLGATDMIRKAKGVPFVVVDEVKGSGGGMTVHKGADPLYPGANFIYFAVKDTNTNCPTIAHELWHQAGNFTHDGTKGGIVDCTSLGVTADYCAAMRSLAK